jgi:hypothetical protein
MHHVRDVLAERIITALVMLLAPAVDPHRRVAEHAVERQPDALAFVFLRQIKRAAIPSNAVRRILHAECVKTVAAVGGPVKRQFHRPVVRHIDGAPKRIGKLFRRRPATGSRVHETQRIRPVVAEMEFPVGVERKMFARRLGGGQWHD